MMGMFSATTVDSYIATYVGHAFFLSTTSNLFAYFKSLFFIPSYLPLTCLHISKAYFLSQVIFMILPGFVIMHERFSTFRPKQSLPPQ